MRAREARHVVHPAHRRAPAALAHDALAALGAGAEVVARLGLGRSAASAHAPTDTHRLFPTRRPRSVGAGGRRPPAALGARVELLLDGVVEIMGSTGGWILNGLVKRLVGGGSATSSTARGRCLLPLLLQILLQMITFERGREAQEVSLNDLVTFLKG